MKKRPILFLVILVFSISLLSAAVPNASFTLDAHVRGVTVHGFVKELTGVSGDSGLTVLTTFLDQTDFEGLEPTTEMLYSQDLSLDYKDIPDFDFGESAYEDVAYYLFASNMTTALDIYFTIYEFVNQQEQSITVPWELGVTEVNSDALTINEGKFESGPDPYLIAKATNRLKPRFGILKLSLYVEEEDGYVVSGDYIATVIASITAS